jgi:hypothetical protein
MNLDAIIGAVISEALTERGLRAGVFIPAIGHGTPCPLSNGLGDSCTCVLVQVELVLKGETLRWMLTKTEGDGFDVEEVPVTRLQ